MSELQDAYAELERIAKRYVRKDYSKTAMPAKVANAVAVAKATASNPALTRRILRLEKQETIRKQLGLVEKTFDLEDDADEWSRMFSKADEDDSENEEDRLRRELHDLRDREAEITEQIRSLHF